MENKADKANLALLSGLISAYTNKPVDTKLIAKKDQFPFFSIFIKSFTRIDSQLLQYQLNYI